MLAGRGISGAINRHIDNENRGREMGIREIEKELRHRLHMMESERNKLRGLESELSEHTERYDSAMDSLTECIDRLSEVV